MSSGGRDQAAHVFVHPQAICESAKVGAQTRIWAFSHVMAGAHIGQRCNVGGNCFVENDVVVGDDVVIKNGVSLWDLVTLEDRVFVGPNAVFTNDLVPRADPRYKRERALWLPTLVCEGASIGANATIVCGVTIGRHALVAAGAVVTCDVPDYALVIGCPAQVRGFVCVCGRRLDEQYRCSCRKRYVVDGAGRVSRPADGADAGL